MPAYLVVIIVIACAALLIWTRHIEHAVRSDRRRVREAWSRLAAQQAGVVFSHEMLEGLPGPVQRYFRHAIAEGTKLLDGVELWIDGEMKLKPDGPDVPFRSRERIRHGEGLVWQAQARMGGLAVSGYDMYLGGEGRMSWRLLGLFSVVEATGPQVSESAAGRMAAELVWLPGMLLPQFGARWSAESENELRCRLAIDSHSFELRLWIDGEGRLEKLRMLRLHNGEDGSAELRPFGMESSADFSAGGLRIPGDCKVAWLPDDPERFEFWHGVVRGVVQGDP